MIKSLKEIRKALSASKKEREHDEQGRAIIDLRVIDDSYFLSPYSTATHNIIAEDVSDFWKKREKERFHELAPPMKSW